MPETFQLKSSQFRRERELVWRELEDLIERYDRRGPRALTAEELARLPGLYRNTASSLSVARAISLDRNLLLYLENLVRRAYITVYGTKRPPFETILRFVRREFPLAVRRYAPFLAVSIGLMLLGVLCGLLLTLDDEERYYSLVPRELAQNRAPSSSTESLRSVLYSGRDPGGDGEEEEEQESGGLAALNVFASFLFTRNAGVGILCFALGFAAGAPTVFLLFYNGLLLGAMSALYHSRGLGAEFWAWVLPHGITELGAVCLCGMAGLVIGHALVFPGPYGRLENLARRGRRAATIVIGAVVLFLIAALIEGFFRQLVDDVAVRWSLAVASLAFWTGYFLWSGREDDASNHA